MGSTPERREGRLAAPSGSFSCSWVEVFHGWLSLAWAVTGLRGPMVGKDTPSFCPGPHEGLGSTETTASSCAPASFRAAGAAGLMECRELGSWEVACRGGHPGPKARSLDSSSDC